MFFLYFLLIIIMIFIITVTSKIELQFKNFKFNSKNKNKIKNDYKIIIKYKILCAIPIIKYTITHDKINKVFSKPQVRKKIKEEIYKKKFDLEILKIQKEISKYIEINNMYLEIILSTNNAMTTSIIVAFLASAMAIMLAKKQISEKNVKYNIKPIYNNQNLIIGEFSGIFQIKMIHIINIYVLKRKEGVKNNERTSHRRSYDYSYE